ncbi:hypothetical protein NJB14191_22490 [Mycobacterium montefiorense]|nr:hypothetical protein NJB14191_22490 [Mycobacterium montefiorense]GKU47025.1 hypothetical protein NJB14194_36430 [Mycobacterium montefiorense]GKU49145.1 hypothetical protein NJB14195_03920 [Mycobacterium montefiorense]GKU62367.1 hypothetical protein NJB18182_28680 [Mycobacterium montefiorense]GKU66062.1 hypothetical protein NJB18183_12110 [Mycobacterium montefiorense]
MGLATAKIVGSGHAIVLCDVRQDRLDSAAGTLKDLGVTATAVNCDVTDRRAVTDLLETAKTVGTIASVIHTAGVSPSMGAADYVMRTNAIGTVNINEVFYASAGEGSVIVNVASMAAHMLPTEMIPAEQFPLALTDGDAFMDTMMTACEIAPEDARSGIAYALSKSFVKWYSQAQAERFNARGLRIVSVSPGSIDTEMGRRDGGQRRGTAVGQAGGNGRATRLLRQRQGGLSHRHRHPQRRRGDRLDDRARPGGRRQLDQSRYCGTNALSIAAYSSRVRLRHEHDGDDT